MQRTERTLLEALHHDPLDDTNWLALADCLEEQGQEDQAELLRLHRDLRVLPEGRQRSEKEGQVRDLLALGLLPVTPTLVNSVGMRLALIPPGVFRMGSPDREAQRCSDEGPRHVVEITRPFYIGVTTVTQEVYERVVGHNPSYFSAKGDGASEVEGLDTRPFPVDSVSWYDARAFCEALSRLPGEKGRRYRLPTEAEWEYACRAWVADSTPFHYGDSLSSALANIRASNPYGELTPGPNLERTCAVGSYPPNAWGLYDLHGNVWEWCSDYFAREAYHSTGLRDPQGPTIGTTRVLRGGSYNFEAWLARTACRVAYPPEHRVGHVGFRVVMTPVEWAIRK